METFSKIGEACGGLIDIAPETKNQTFFMYAMLKVKGFPNGFLHPIAEIPCEKETVHVGLFSLGFNPGNGQARFGTTRGILARSLEGRIHSLSQINCSEKVIGRDTGVVATAQRETRKGSRVSSEKRNREEMAEHVGDVTDLYHEKADRVRDGSGSKSMEGLTVLPQNTATEIVDSNNCRSDFWISSK